MRCIGSQEVESTFYVTLPIEFDEITLEVDLHAVSPEFLNTPLIIGTEVLNREGVTYVRTRDQQYLTYKHCLTSNVMCVSSTADTPVKTSLVGRDLDRLRDLINEFSTFLISGTAATTVNTGSMLIKLTSTIPINYRPYTFVTRNF